MDIVTLRNLLVGPYERDDVMKGLTKTDRWKLVFITDHDYSKLTERAKATRALDFKKLLEMELIERFGRGRLTHYKLKRRVKTE